MLDKKPARDYRDLIAWQRSMQLARTCYEISAGIPHTERFGLVSQIRRAAVSVPANIAEGNGRFSRRDYLRHLSIANGSLKELETLVQLARDIGYLDAARTARVLSLSTAVGQLLVQLSRGLRETKGRDTVQSSGRFPIPDSRFPTCDHYAYSSRSLGPPCSSSRSLGPGLG
jgi:four helix bundle protein